MFQILKQQPPQRQEHTYSIKQHELIRSLFLAMTRGLSKVLVKHAISSDYADVLVVSALCLPQCTRGASFPSLTWCARVFSRSKPSPTVLAVQRSKYCLRTSRRGAARMAQCRST